MYKKIIDSNRDEIIAMLQDLVSFESVQSDPLPDAPFGKGVNDVFHHMLDIGEKDGFDVVNVDNYGGHIEWPGIELSEDGSTEIAAKETLGIAVHLDVVPIGEGWSVDPLGGEIVEDKIYGRGTSDNKGAICATYFAMKALRETGFVPRKNIRLILGLDEETGWVGMKKYLEKVDTPDFGYSPDAAFPVINGEMGVLSFEIAKKLQPSHEKGLQLRSIDGGNADNMVPDWAKAIVFDETGKGYDKIKQAIEDFKKRTDYKISGNVRGKAFEISTKGISAHGAHPEKGLNAISILMDFLGELDFANESIKEYIDFYINHIAHEVDGKGLGVAMSDSLSGNLVLNVGVISVDKEVAILTINIRYPVSNSDEDVFDALRPLVDKYDFGIVKTKEMAPIYFAPDSEFVETLMSVYRENTGKEKARPFVIGGGTYARAIPNAVAFGPHFPHDKDVAHQKDEFQSISSMMMAAHIYADAIYKLTK